MKARGRAIIAALCATWAMLGWAQGLVVFANETAQVTVKQVDSLGNTLAEDAYASTDATFTTVSAPKVAGKRFVEWRSDPEQPNFVVRDVWGRAYEQVSVIPKDTVVTLTAVYEDAGDAAERHYWYGMTSTVAMDSDTDNDGFTFAEELQYGMNPHFPNTLVLGGVTYGDSAVLLYNPYEYTSYLLRSEPEGELFESQWVIVEPGTEVTTESYSPKTSTFAYWSIDGVRQTDVFGVATNQATFVMPERVVEVVAHCVEDEAERLARYWYGGVQAADSDTDNDGFTFAEELQYGMNPHFPNTLVLGGVTYGDSNLLIYNPNQYSPYTVMANPETTFETITGYLRPNETYTTTSYAKDATFAYWTLNGVRQADAFGRALDSVTIVGDGDAENGQTAVAHFTSDTMTEDQRKIAYWYGPESDVTMDSDTDGDGYTLAEEIQYGMNPLFANQLLLGGVTYGDGPLLEVNLQPFDMSEKALVEDELIAFFATLDPMTGDLEGGLPLSGAVAVAALDVDADGDFDLLVHTAAQGLTLCRNIGSVGSPNFEVQSHAYPVLEAALAELKRPILCAGDGQIAFCDNGGAVSIYTLAENTIEPTTLVGFPLWSADAGFTVLSTLTLGTPVADVTSAVLCDVTADRVVDLLVADNSGRISLYTLSGESYTLQHRVWGGSYVGFASGLTMAPVDWDGDGDMDMVGGTSDGKLVLLSDPNVGAPSNLRAAAGYDNVLLEWNPNGQSRVYGYNVYRAQSASSDFARQAETQLPTYRDTPPSIANWAYCVSALSRRWIAGNSEPEVFESRPSATVSVSLGSVTLELPETVDGYVGQVVAVPLTLNNSCGIPANFSLSFTYDATALEPITLSTSALAEGLELSESAANGTWTISCEEGNLAAGAGELLRLQFRAKSVADASAVETVVKLTGATFGSVPVSPELPLVSAVTLSAPPTGATTAILETDDVEATEATVDVPISLVVSGTLNWETFTLTADYDADLLELISAPVLTETALSGSYTFKVRSRTNEPQVAEIAFSAYAQDLKGNAIDIAETTSNVVIHPKNGYAFAFVLLRRVHDKDTDFWHRRHHFKEVAVGETVTLKVKARVWGDLDWSTLNLTADWEPEDCLALDLDTVVQPTKDNPIATFTFKVVSAPEKRDPRKGKHHGKRGRHGDGAGDDIGIVFDGTARSTAGNTVPVWGTWCAFEIDGRVHPSFVTPWKNGDCDGDGRLTGNDYQVARETVAIYHKNRAPEHTPYAWTIHQSICMALGKPKYAPLSMADITNSFKKYLWEHGVHETNMGNGNGGKK